MNFLKLLFNPIFLLAAGLHAGLLLIPVAGGSSEDVVPAPDPEGESITVTRIPPKQDQPKKADAGQPATASGRSTTSSKATSGAGQQSQGSNRRSQGSQSASGQSSSADSSSTGQANSSSGDRRNNNQSNQTARNSDSNRPPGLPDLPGDSNSNSVPVETVPPESSTPQEPPTLIALKDGAESQTVPQLLKDFLARLQYRFLETRDSAAEEAKQTWLAKLEEQSGGEISPPKELEKALEISYPIVVDDNGPREILGCLNPLPEPGLLGVVVDNNGAIAVEPVMLRSSGYTFLNEAALGKIQDYSDFPEASSSQAYLVPVEIAYNSEACVELAELTDSTTAENGQ